MTPGDNGPLVLMTREDLRALLSEELARHLAPVLASLAALGEDATPATGGPLMTRAELAAALGLNMRSIQRMSMAGELPAPIRVGKRSVRYSRPEIEAWLKTRQGAA